MLLVEVGKVIGLYYSTNNGRVSTHELALDEKGVVEDKYYNKDIDRSVLMASQRSYELASDEGIKISYGSLGENILIDYNPYHLKPGTRLQVGQLLLEMSQNCTLCKSFAKVDERLPELLKNDRGIFAKVITGGTVCKGDNIYLLDKQ